MNEHAFSIRTDDSIAEAARAMAELFKSLNTLVKMLTPLLEKQLVDDKERS